MFKHAVVSVFLALAAVATFAQTRPFDPSSVEEAMQMKGSYNAAENVYKVTKPRQNLSKIGSWTVPPFLGTTSYAAFANAGEGRVQVMGDTVLLEDEVGNAMSAALENGLEVTALHNHFFFEQPRLFYMHIGGQGDAGKLAVAVKKVWDAADAVRKSNGSQVKPFPSPPSQSSITGDAIAQAMGKKGEMNNGMYKVSYGRPVMMHGAQMGDAMGVNTWAGFAGTDDNAVMVGDFAVMDDELQPVLKSLRQSGINVVAIHQHMTHEDPPTIFLHYWGQGQAKALAQGVRQAVSKTATMIGG